MKRSRPTRVLVLIAMIVALHSSFTSSVYAQDEAEEETMAKEAHYLKLHPDILVNLARSEDAQAPRFLLATVQVMTREESTLAEIRHHRPALRHHLVLLLSDQEFNNVAHPSKREVLRANALETLNEILAAEGTEGTIEGLYFTNFIVE